MNHVPVLLAASTVAMIGLVYFQYQWITNSKELYNEVFHQRACMALCSTLEEYGEGAICSKVTCAPAGDLDNFSETAPLQTDASLIYNEGFQHDLRRTLEFYNIDLQYQISQSACQPASGGKSDQPTCIVNVPGNEESEASFISLDFPDQQTVMLSKLKFMIGASVVILLFTAIVLLLANWWLLKQKRLLKTNVEMYNNMAHEFRTPLTNIQLAASLLPGIQKDPREQKLMDIIHRENGKLITQVERVLNLSRLESGEYDLNQELIPLRNLLERVREEHQLLLDECKGVIHLNIPNDLVITGDVQHISNVFRNLIDNALKYTKADPVITVEAKDEKKGITITVQDNGVGIPLSRTEMIFEKFQRLQEGNVHTQKGFGLGLAYVRKIVELHKGRIGVVSEINRGSCFTIFLPKYDHA